jgi:spore maturation protein CgeB
MTDRAGRKLTILYAGQITPNDNALYRLWALERLGHRVIPFSTSDYAPGGRILQALAFRFLAGPAVARFNRDLLALAERERPDVLLADKLLFLQPATLIALRKRGIATISYNSDNCFGPRRDPGWRLYRNSIQLFDLHVTPRDVNLAAFREAGARNVLKTQFAYEPTLQYPPPPGWSDRDRDRPVSFIGTPYDDRASQLMRLWREREIAITINGSPRQWKRALDPEALAALFQGEEFYRDRYRNAIWRSRINLAFVTHSNQDEFAHKSFEIAACGGFLLAERTEGHLSRFEENREAVFFQGVDELAAQIRRFLPDEPARARIAAAGRARAERDGYHNDRQMALIVERLHSILPAVKAAAIR